MFLYVFNFTVLGIQPTARLMLYPKPFLKLFFIILLYEYDVLPACMLSLCVVYVCAWCHKRSGESFRSQNKSYK